MKRQFLLSFLASLLLTSTVIAVAVSLYTRDVIKEIHRNNMETTASQIEVILGQYDRIFNAFQVELNREGREAILKVAAELGAPSVEASPAELKQLAIRHGADEIYFINRDGIVFNTSFPPDRNLNLFKTSVFFENYLRSIFGKGQVFTPAAAIGSNSGTINKYIYYSPKNTDYILEISYNLKRYISRRYSTNYYDFMSLKKIQELVKSNPYLIDIDLVAATENRNWSLLTVGKQVRLPPRIISETLRAGRVSVDHGNQISIYINATENGDLPSQLSSGFSSPSRILILVYDISMLKRHARNLFLLMTATITFLTLAVFIIFSMYFNRKYISRIISINSGLEQIARGNYHFLVNIPGKDELGLIAANINRMTDEIRVREEQLLKSEKRFRSIFEHAPVGIVIFDLNRQIQYFNPAFNVILRYGREDIVNKDIVSFLIKDDIPRLVRNFSMVARGETDSCTNEHKLLRKDHKTVLAAITIASIRDENNSPTHVIGMIEDVTSRSHTEQQLFQSQKMDAIGKLAGGVAHDFNNLLQVILGYGNILNRYLVKDPRAQDIWRNITDAGERARSLVRQLLTFSRPKVSAGMNKVNLKLTLQSFLSMVSRVLGEDIEVEFLPEEKIPPVKGEPTQLEQVFMNLCVNARDSMPHGGKLSIRMRPVFVDERETQLNPGVRSGHYVKTSFTDSGTGMDEETMSHIFEPFFSTKDSSRGSGIGLATVYAIVNAHGGFIRVESEPGKGSAFHIFIPAAAEDDSAAAEPESDTVTDGGDISGAGELILLCEDETQVRELASIMINEAGYKVISAADGEESIGMYEKNKHEIGLVILDMIMPKKSGKQVFAHIRADNPSLPVLFTTGYSHEMLGDEFGEHVIQKPYQEDVLLKHIATLLKAGK